MMHLETCVCYKYTYFHVHLVALDCAAKFNDMIKPTGFFLQFCGRSDPPLRRKNLGCRFLQRQQPGIFFFLVVLLLFFVFLFPHLLG